MLFIVIPQTFILFMGSPVSGEIGHVLGGMAPSVKGPLARSYSGSEALESVLSCPSAAGNLKDQQKAFSPYDHFGH